MNDFERQLWAEACLRDMWTFANYGFGIANWAKDPGHRAWMTLRLHKPLCDWYGWHIKDWLRRRPVANRRRKLLVVWPRHFGKTTTITKAGQLWAHLQDPDLATVTDSVTQTKSFEFTNAIRDVIEGANPYAWFPQLYGNWVGNRNWKTGSMTHNRRITHGRSEASFEATSVEVGLTGKHPDAVFIDDPVTIEKLREGEGWLKVVDTHIDALIPVVPSNGLIVASATRYRDYDWIGRLIKEEGVRSLNGMQPRDPDFDLTEDGQWDFYFMRARDDLGNPVLPEQWDDVALRDYENKAPMEYAAQMMNEPGEGAHMPITWAQVERLVIEPREVPTNLTIVICCDAAFKSPEKAGRGDFSVIQVWGLDDRSGDVYFLDGQRSNTWGADDFANAFVLTLQDLKAAGRRIRCITYDEESGGLKGTMKSFLMSAAHAHNLPLPPTKPMRRSLKKIVRIQNAAMYWRDGRVKLVRTARNWKQLATEMVRLGVAKTKDMADAGADVFADGVYYPQQMQSEHSGNYRPIRPWDDEMLSRPISSWSDDFARRVAASASQEREEEALEWPIH